MSLAVVAPEGVLVQAFGGRSCLVDETVATTPATRYDLASLTKVVCTTTLVLLAAERGALALEDEVVRWLPRYPEPRTTLWHLLTHTSGLVAHVPFYLTGTGRGPIEQLCTRRRPVRSRARSCVIPTSISCCSGGCSKPAWGGASTGPLRPRWRRRSGLGPRGFAHLRPTVRARRPPSSTVTSASGLGLVWGEVHDGNAYYLGGVAGHAGLFAPLSDLARFVQALLGPEAVRLLSAESIVRMSTLQASTGCRPARARLAARTKRLGDVAPGHHLAHRFYRYLVAGLAGPRGPG